MRIIHAELIFKVWTHGRIVAVNLADGIGIACGRYKVSRNVNVKKFCNIVVDDQIRIKIDGLGNVW